LLKIGALRLMPSHWLGAKTGCHPDRLTARVHLFPLPQFLAAQLKLDASRQLGLPAAPRRPAVDGGTKQKLKLPFEANPY